MYCSPAASNWLISSMSCNMSVPTPSSELCFTRHQFLMLLWVIAGAGLPTGLLIYGWSARYKAHLAQVSENSSIDWLQAPRSHSLPIAYTFTTIFFLLFQHRDDMLSLGCPCCWATYDAAAAAAASATCLRPMLHPASTCWVLLHIYCQYIQICSIWSSAFGCITKYTPAASFWLGV